MNHLQSLRKSFAATVIIFMMTLTNAQAALDTATLTNDINSLVLQGNDLLVSINATTLTSLSMSSQLDTVETDVTNYQAQVMATFDTIVAESGTNFSLSDDLLVAFQTLSTVSSSLATATQGLGLQIADIASTTSVSTLDSSLTTMLRLSDDIGLMADRILEMANKILIMADNIGLMADRIIATQIIQSDNLKLVINATLQTQTNTIDLITLFL